MIRLFLAVIFLLPLHLLKAQHKYDSQWVFGYGANLEEGFELSILDFNDGLVTLSPYLEFPTFEIGGSGNVICNDDGQVYLMTNNCTVVDRDLNIIDNGDTITPGPFYHSHCELIYDYPVQQTTLLLPSFDGDSVVYLVHKDGEVSAELQEVPSKNLYLSIINYSISTNSYQLIETEKLIVDEDLIWGRLTGVRHGEGQGWWIWAIGYNTNLFYMFRVGYSGASHEIVLQNIGPEVGNHDLFAGQSSFSPDGSMLAINSSSHGVMLYDFDDLTGELSNYRGIPYPGMESAHGLCFSPNSRFIYVNNVFDTYQIDLQPPNPDAAEPVFLGNLEMQDINGWPVASGLMYIGPDCRIYISPASSCRVTHVIHHPNREGGASDLQKAAIRTQTRIAHYFPNLPMYRFNGSCDSTIAWGIVSPTEEVVLDGPPPDSYLMPNPARGSTTLFLPAGHSGGEVLLGSIQGQVLRRWAVGPLEREVELGVAGLAAGLYWVKVNGYGQTTMKLVVK